LAEILQILSIALFVTVHGLKMPILSEKPGFGIPRYTKNGPSNIKETLFRAETTIILVNGYLFSSKCRYNKYLRKSL
jgi:hypothetical protein